APLWFLSPLAAYIFEYSDFFGLTLTCILVKCAYSATRSIEQTRIVKVRTIEQYSLVLISLFISGLSVYTWLHFRQATKMIALAQSSLIPPLIAMLNRRRELSHPLLLAVCFILIATSTVASVISSELLLIISC
ncbi:hypothetical protein PMAYCL1PPCAC_20297, partial [Pristionchus mayeri]